MNSKITSVIIGAGSHGRVIYEVLRRLGQFNALGFLDDDKRLHEKRVDGCVVLGAITKFEDLVKELKIKLLEVENFQAEAGLRNSVAGRIGIALESVSRLAGFDWRTNIALVGGFAAKEVIVSTLGTAYSLGEVDPEESTSLKTRLSKDKNWNPIVALAALAFIMFYAPCFVTVICIAKESGSWNWAYFSMAFNTVFAFGLAALIYNVGMFITG